jgi:HAD superfamily hydrolase (TIGR01509 family)
MVSVVLWDLMDTLVRDPFFTHIADFFGISFEELLRAKHPSAWAEFEVGRISEEQLFATFFRDGRSIDGPGLKRKMHEAYVWIEGMDAMLRELAERGVEMHLLSNYPPWYELCDERLGVSRWVRPSFVSCKTGVRKPSADAYLGACRKLGRAPEECLFIDDREVNCHAARELGVQAIRFEGDPRSLRSELTTRGLL